MEAPKNSRISQKTLKKKERVKEEKRGKVEDFLQQLKQRPHYIRLFMHEKYHILTAESYHPMESLGEKFYVCEIYHKHLCEDEIPCHTDSLQTKWF